MIYNKNDIYGIHNALDNWITREDGSVYDDGYGYEGDLEDYDDE